MDDSPKGGTGDGAGAGDASAANELKEDMVVVRGQESLQGLRMSLVKDWALHAMIRVANTCLENLRHSD